MTVANIALDAIAEALTAKEEKHVRLVALTSHDVNYLHPDTPVEEQQVNGRPAMIFTGENLEDYILVRLPKSGLPVPQVKDTSATMTEEILVVSTEAGEVKILAEVSSSGGEEIVNLPPAEEGVAYITSSFTANTALLQGRTDVYAPRQLVCVLNKDGSTTIVGTLGFKKGG